MPHASSDVSSNDEVKVYRVEGEGDDESSAENLKEEKRSLLTEVALKEESRAVEAADRSIPSSEQHHNQHHHHPPHQPHVGALAGGKHFEYFPSPPFGYVPGYHPHARSPYGALPMVGRVPLVPSNHPPSPLSLMMYSAEQFQPPPAHMGIHIDPKTGMPRPSVFPLPPSQFHPPHVFPPDYSQQYSWHHNPVYPVTSGFRSPPYPLALSPLIHPLLPPVTAKPERQTDNQDGRYMCNFSPSSPFSGFSNGGPPPSQQGRPPSQPRRAPRSSNNEKKQSHIKKPLNAFMLFMKEQRPQVVAECTLKESAAINQILGKKWHSLTREEQSKYYEMARSERQMHMQRYPGWTARDNYAINAKKKKRKRDKSQDGDGNNPKKCRARYGLDKQSSWCKPCRRKKKCIRYRSGSDNTAGESEDNLGSSAQTPDSRYGGEEEDVSDTDSGNEEDASSEFSLSSPPLRPPSLDRVQTSSSSQPLGSPPSQQSSHPLNVQLLSQPHLPRTRLSTELQSPPKTIESHLPLLQQTTESHLQRLSQMADPHLQRPHLTKDPQLSRPHPTTDSKLPRPHQTLDLQLQRPHQTTDLKVLHQMTDPHVLRSQQTTDLKVPHQTTDPKLPLSLLTKDPQLQRSHQTIEPNLLQPRPMTDPQMARPHQMTELPLVRTPVEAHRTTQPLQGT